MGQAAAATEEKIVFVLCEDIYVLSEKNCAVQTHEDTLPNDKIFNLSGYIYEERESAYLLREDSTAYSGKSLSKRKKGNRKSKNVGTPYDDVFHTLANDCSVLLIPLVNEFFHENYQGTESVTMSPNIHFVLLEDDGQQKRLNDSHFSIASGDLMKRYHIECQSTEDGTILLRVFEYGSLIAIRNSQLIDDKLIIQFPNSALLALRHTQRTPDSMEVIIQTPESEASYHVPVLKIGQYTWRELFEKKLYLLLPFHIFTYEKDFKKAERDEELLQQIRHQYIQIITELTRLCECGEITEHTKQTIMAMSRRVFNALAAKHKKVKEGVGEIMGGQILEYEAKTIYHEGIQYGYQKGIQKGIQKGWNTLGSEALKLIRAGKLEEAEKLLENPKQNISIFTEEL